MLEVKVKLFIGAKKVAQLRSKNVGEIDNLMSVHNAIRTVLQLQLLTFFLVIFLFIIYFLRSEKKHARIDMDQGSQTSGPLMSLTEFLSGTAKIDVIYSVKQGFS